jgi:hypothetical protein
MDAVKPDNLHIAYKEHRPSLAERYGGLLHHFGSGLQLAGIIIKGTKVWDILEICDKVFADGGPGIQLDHPVQERKNAIRSIGASEYREWKLKIKG